VTSPAEWLVGLGTLSSTSTHAIMSACECQAGMLIDQRKREKTLARKCGKCRVGCVTPRVTKNLN
jgi:hypothetical protein